MSDATPLTRSPRYATYSATPLDPDRRLLQVVPGGGDVGELVPQQIVDEGGPDLEHPRRHHHPEPGDVHGGVVVQAGRRPHRADDRIEGRGVLPPPGPVRRPVPAEPLPEEVLVGGGVHDDLPLPGLRRPRPPDVVHDGLGLPGQPVQTLGPPPFADHQDVLSAGDRHPPRGPGLEEHAVAELVVGVAVPGEVPPAVPADEGEADHLHHRTAVPSPEGVRAVDRRDVDVDAVPLVELPDEPRGARGPAIADREREGRQRPEHRPVPGVKLPGLGIHHREEPGLVLDVERGVEDDERGLDLPVPVRGLLRGQGGDAGCGGLGLGVLGRDREDVTAEEEDQGREQGGDPQPPRPPAPSPWSRRGAPLRGVSRREVRRMHRPRRQVGRMHRPRRQVGRMHRPRREVRRMHRPRRQVRRMHRPRRQVGRVHRSGRRGGGLTVTGREVHRMHRPRRQVGRVHRSGRRGGALTVTGLTVVGRVPGCSGCRLRGGNRMLGGPAHRADIAVTIPGHRVGVRGLRSTLRTLRDALCGALRSTLRDRRDGGGLLGHRRTVVIREARAPSFPETSRSVIRE